MIAIDRAPWLATALLALCLISSTPAKAQQTSVADPAQVERGAAAYAANCASCHGVALTGGGGPPLNGPGFNALWLSNPAELKALNAKLRTMPLGAAGSLPDKTYDDLKAYIVATNAAEAPRNSPPAAKSDIVFPTIPASVAAPTTSAPTEAELAAPADGDWLMYNRTLAGDRYSPLAQINTANAGHLQVACILQLGQTGVFETSPVIYQGVGYITTAHDTIAFDAATCDKKWTYTATPNGREMLLNRGVALYAGAVFRVTSDGHLLALDAATGKLLWDVRVLDNDQGYFTDGAPIVIHGLVVIGAGGPIGHVMAFDARTGRRVWNFNTVPGPGEPGYETWKAGAATGGGPTWTSFAADLKDNLVLAPVGNPYPDFLAAARPGVNLYTNSVVALDATSGKLAWYDQQRVPDEHDWDTAAAPVLFEQDGRRYMAEGSKDGFLYLYDRDSHALIAKTPVTTVRNTDVPLAFGKPVYACPGFGGGVEWNGPAYSPAAKALFVGTVDWCGTFTLGVATDLEGGQFNFNDDQSGWIKALDAASGRELWSYHAPAPVIGGVTATAGGVVLAGDSGGEFLVFDARDGRILYRFHTGASIGGGVSTYAAGGRQYVAVASGNRSYLAFGAPGAATIVVFALPQ